MAALERRSRLSLVACAWLVCGCGADPVTPSTTRIDALIAGVTAQSGHISAVLSDSAPPRATAGPLAQVSERAVVSHARGGRAHIGVAGASHFTRVYVSSPAATGRWDLQLPSGVTTEDLDISINPSLRAGRLTVRYTLQGPTGVGGASEQTIEIGN